MVERQLPKLNVAGSSPVYRSKKKRRAQALLFLFGRGENGESKQNT